MLSDNNITLRALEPSDIEWLYKWENDTSIWNVSNTVAPYSRHVLEQYLLNSHLDIYTTKQLRFVIDLSGDGRSVGCIDLFDFDPRHQRVGVGILIGEKEEQGKGYASAALKLLIDYCFKTLALRQIYCNICSENENSVKLFMRHDFEITGVKKQWLNEDGKWKDELLLQLINDL